MAAVQKPAWCGEGLDVTSCAKVTRQFSDGHLWPAEMVQQLPWHLCWWKHRGGWSSSAVLLRSDTTAFSCVVRVVCGARNGESCVPPYS